MHHLLTSVLQLEDHMIYQNTVVCDGFISLLQDCKGIFIEMNWEQLLPVYWSKLWLGSQFLGLPVSFFLQANIINSKCWETSINTVSASKGKHYVQYTHTHTRHTHTQNKHQKQTKKKCACCQGEAKLSKTY